MRLIDADELITLIRKNDYMVCDNINSRDRGMFTIGIEQAINQCKDIDAAPVVLCKDCKYWSDYDWRPLEMYPDDANHKYCELINTITHAGFCCGLAERKTNDSH